jgi:hypothetical protein
MLAVENTVRSERQKKMTLDYVIEGGRYQSTVYLPWQIYCNTLCGGISISGRGFYPVRGLCIIQLTSKNV